MTMTYRDGKFKLLKLQMTAPAGRTIVFSNQVAKLEIYESILEPTVIAEFTIADRIGIFNNFNFKEQTISVEFTTYEDNDKASVKYDFIPIKVDPAVSTNDDKAVVYKVTCVTKEAVKATQIKNVPLVKKMTESESVINAMLNLVETDKDRFLEKTRGLHAFNIGGMTPFQAIDEARQKAMSTKYNSHCFVFFENSKGFNFKCIESLIEDGLTKIGDKYYTQIPLANATTTGSAWRNILGLKVIQIGNEDVTRAIGGGKVLIKSKNMITGKITDYDTDPSKIGFVTLNKDSVSQSGTTQKELSKDEGRIELVRFDPETETEDPAEAKMNRTYFMANFLNTICYITVHGDSTVTVGDVITCDIKEHNSLTKSDASPAKEDNRMLNGNYLVTKVKHILTFNENAGYVQALEIVKDGLGGTTTK